MAKTMPRRACLKLWLALLLAGVAGRAAATEAQIWVCTHGDCEPYRYDPRRGDPEPVAAPYRPVPPGTPFAALPEDWRCPLCGAPKASFRPEAGSA